MTELKSICFPVCAVICALAFLYKLRDLSPGRRDPALLALLTAFLFKGISFTLSTPVVSATVDSYLGIPNLGALGIHLAGGVTSSAAFLAALVFWVYPTEKAWPKVRRRLTLFGLVAVMMLVLWYMAGPGGEGRSAHYLLQNSHRPAVAAYLLLYVIAFAAGLVEIARLGWRYAKVAGPPWLRRGLKVTAVGAAIYIVYCVNRALAVIAVQIGLRPLEWEALTPLSNGIGILLVASGFTMPSWGPRLSAARVWIADYRAYQRLYPLWRDLYETVPEIALNPPAPPFIERIRHRNLHYRLYRLVIETRDGLLVLRPYMDTGVAAAAAEKVRESHPEEEGRHAVEEAVRLKTALEARGADLSPPGQSAGTDVPNRSCEDYASDLSWLLQVAREYADIREDKTGAPNEVPSAW